MSVRRGSGRASDHSADSWLAIDVGTAPTLRAQELRFAWERFVEDLAPGADDDEGDPALVRSRSASRGGGRVAAGVDPTGRRTAPVVADEDEAESAVAGAPARRAPRR